MEGKNKKKAGFLVRLGLDVKKNRVPYLMFLPVFVFFVVFCYVPMAWLAMSFFDYVPRLGFAGSEFVGFKYFIEFFTKRDGWHLIYNTFILNVWDLAFSFVSPIILALMFFEMPGRKVRNTMQSITYLPHFVSLVVVCGMIVQFTKSDGLFSNISHILFGTEYENILDKKGAYIPIFVISNIWQEVGFASVIYFAALCSVDIQLFDAAKIDGAGKLVRIWKISVPSIMPTIVIMFILRMGSMLNVGFEKAFLLQTDMNITISEVISTHVYNAGLKAQNYGYGTAVGLFNSVVNLAFLLAANFLSRRTETSLF